MSAERVGDLRAALAEAGVDGFLVPRVDEHLGEYVPPSAERLAWITGFTGSAGMAIVLPERAALFTDGRYTTQAAAQADPAIWEQRHLTAAPPAEWLKQHAIGRRIGYDPHLHPEVVIERLRSSGATMVPLNNNPVDAVWTDRPAPPAGLAEPHPARFAGETSDHKREGAAALLRAAGEDAAVLADPHSVAWLLNIRGNDLPHTPLALSRAILKADGTVTLFMDAAKLSPNLRDHLGDPVSVEQPGFLGQALTTLAGKRVRLDPDNTPAWFAHALREAGATVTTGEDPCRAPRARKNLVERDGARAAHGRDAIALIRFLHWFAEQAPGGMLTETSAADHLLALRRELDLFVAESFPAISGAGPNGAIVHYRAERGNDRAIGRNECYLIDSGAQFRDGTTDVTRTLWTGPDAPPAELVERYTRVLRGHVALATLRFPVGVAGPHLDAIARRPLWDAGLDYDHGTGHGVGSFLSVHEGPVAISRAAKPVPIAEGMILSDEPGFYLPGHYGIRVENLLLVRPDESGATKPFLRFETLTLAPYERKLIAPELLTTAEREWINSYHARVAAEVSPMLDAGTAGWLSNACAPL